MDANDHYEVLGVCRDADVASIRSAYKRMSLQWHPDKCQESIAAQIFHKVQLAMQTLTDPLQRAAYDSTLKSMIMVMVVATVMVIVGFSCVVACV